jgi:hypothetical protein
MKKLSLKKTKQLYDRHGNKVYPPNAEQHAQNWMIDCGIYQEMCVCCNKPGNRFLVRTPDNPPVLLTGIWDQ